MVLWLHMNYDIENWDAQDIPQTEMLQTVQDICSDSPLEQYLGAFRRCEPRTGSGNWADTDFNPDGGPDRWISATEFYRLYNSWTSKVGVRSGIIGGLSGFGRELSDHVESNAVIKKHNNQGSFYQVQNIISRVELGNLQDEINAA